MRPALQKSLYIFICLSFLLALTGVQPAYAASITVTTTADENNTGASCSLREAITAANTNAAVSGCSAGSGTDTITLPAGTYTLSSELPAVTSTIIINGNGAATTIVQANANPNTSGYRILSVNSGGNLTLNSLTARNGHLTSGDGSAIYSAGTLTITNSAFSGNNTNTGFGGGVYNDVTGVLTITNSTFSANSSGTAGGGVYNASSSTTTITNSTFSANSSGTGGGIYNGGTTTIRNSTLSGNSAINNGGGIFIANTGTLNYANTIIANSTSGGDCGSQFGATIGTNTNNLVEGANCSAALSGDPNLGPLADNGGPTQTMALIYPSSALNAGDDATCAAAPVNNLDQRGMARPQGTKCDIGAYEVVSTQSGPAFVVNSPADTSDGICDLRGQGFGNQDCTLREAIDTANFQAGANTITFDSTYVNAANRITVNNVNITSLPTITTDITITGNGSNSTIIQAATSSGITDKRIFTIQSPGNLTLNQVTLQNGRCASLCTSGGAILNNSGGTLTVNDSLFSENIASVSGGNITNSGTLVVNNSTFIGNASLTSASIGGGIYNVLSGTATIRNSTFSGIYSNSGSAIFNSGGSTLTLVNDTIIDNHSTIGSAGALAIDGGTVNIYNTTISGNTGAATSDNIHQVSGSLNLYNTIVANNSSFGDCVTTGGTFSATNSLIENNGAADCGVTNGNNGNITGSDPALGSLTGSPAYFPLLVGSPAIDTGSNAICAAAPVNNQSQNGITRPAGSACDIGAFEREASFGTISKWTSALDLSHGWTVADFARTTGDVDGDGDADLVGFGLDGVYVALSNGSSFAPTATKWTSAMDLSHGWTVKDFVRTVGDVDGDGDADLVGFGLDGVYVALSNGSSFAPTATKWTSAMDLSHGWTVKDFVRTVGDVDGDGDADLVGFGLDGVYVALSNGSSFAPTATKWTSAMDLSHGWTVKDFVRTVGDVDGDGDADLVGFGLDGVYVALSNGSSFAPTATKWTSAMDLSLMVGRSKTLSARLAMWTGMEMLIW